VLQNDAATAARCALALRRCLPGAAIVVAGPQEDESAVQLTKLFDAAGAALEVADLGQIFASDVDPAAIRIDAATAARLHDSFVIEQGRNAVYLLGERGAS
jgi:hypothetical protein